MNGGGVLATRLARRYDALLLKLTFVEVDTFVALGSGLVEDQLTRLEITPSLYKDKCMKSEKIKSETELGNLYFLVLNCIVFLVLI